MKFLVLKTHDPYYNLAIEEYLFDTSDEDVFMLWQNEPSVIVGKNQNAIAEIEPQYVKENNVHVVRRITGGGAVYHDLGNVNYTYITVGHDWNADFSYFTLPICEAIRSLGAEIQPGGRNDLILSDGRKVSGTAQHVRGKKVLHHGTLLYSSNLDAIAKALRPSKEKLSTRAVKSVSSRVANLSEALMQKITVEELISLIGEEIIKAYKPTVIEPPVSEEIDRLYTRNRSEEWIYPSRDYLTDFDIRRSKRFSFGTLDIDISYSKDRINSVRIQGDFFGRKSIAKLESAVTCIDFSNLDLALEAIDVGEYVDGMTKDELKELLLP